MRAYGVALGVLASVSTARAEDIDFHKGRFGGSVRVGLGVRGIATYENNVYCGKTDPQAEFNFASVCTGRTPLALDLEGSYGVASAVELVLEIRVGLETEFGSNPNTDGPRPFHIAPGARFFFSDSARGKLFVQPELVIDLTGHEAGNDVGVRGIEGYWFDIAPRYGAYVYIAETLGFSRWLSAAFEAGIGFQGRYP